jgi:integrase/recombinase XerC
MKSQALSPVQSQTSVVLTSTPITGSVSLSVVFERVLERVDISESTRKTYRYGIRDFLEWNTNGELTPSSLLDYKKFLRGRSDLSTGTKNLYLNGVKTVVRTLHTHGVLERDYGKVVKGFKVNRTLKRGPITDSEIQRVFSVVRKSEDRRLLPLFSLMYLQGLRQKEILGLRVEDFEPDTLSLWILGKGRDERERVDLHPQSVRILENYLEETGRRSGYLFGSRQNPNGPMTYQNLNVLIRKVHESVGVKNKGHSWRKVFVSKLIDSGMDLLTVSSFSRHKSVEMLKVYYDRLDRTKKLPQYYEVFSTSS